MQFAPALAISLALFASGNAHAIIGEYLPESDNPEATCTIGRIYDYASGGQTQFKPTCSASLVSPSVLITATHCDTDSRLGLVILCGREALIANPQSGTVGRDFAGSTITGFTYSANPRYKNHAHSREDMNQTPNWGMDMGIIFLTESFRSTTPFRVIESKTEMYSLLKKKNACRIAGWGYNNEERATRVAQTILHAGRVHFQDYRMDTDAEDGVLTFSSNAKAGMGDSGGSLVCKDENNQDVLVGTITRASDADSSGNATVAIPLSTGFPSSDWVRSKTSALNR